MKTFKFKIRFLSDNACIERTEWGKTRNQAFKTLCGIYGIPGKDFVLA